MCSLRFFFMCYLTLLTAKSSRGQKLIAIGDTIGFPEKEEIASQANKENREPVYLPSMCPDNELYYPGDQKDDWICDCRPSHIYQPASDKCWPAFRKGPCKEGQYLILPANSFQPVCVPNPCQTDGLVQWNGKCEGLGSTAPCAHLYPNASALGVNANTLQVGCVLLNLESRFIEPPPVTSTCLPGCKRSVNRKC